MQTTHRKGGSNRLMILFAIVVGVIRPVASHVLVQFRLSPRPRPPCEPPKETGEDERERAGTHPVILETGA